MNADLIIVRMAAFPDVLRTLLACTTDEDACFTPPSGAWSILEIVNHLADEEVEDFSTRLRLTLEEPTRDWPPIDPERWATQRGYNDRNLHESLDRFAAARADNIAWLRALDNPDWSQKHTHPKFGSMAAGELLAAWAAHDYLHLRQITKRLYELTQRDAGEYGVGYAGEWVA